MRADRTGAPPTREARAAVALCLALVATGAQAHSSAQGVGDFYAGFLHPLTALEHAAAFLGLGILCGQQGPRAQAALPLFWVALMLGATAALWLPGLPWVDLTNVLSALILGGLIAAAIPLPVPVYLALALLFGLSHGYGNGIAIAPPIRPYLFIPGVGLAGLVVTGYGVVMVDYLLRRRIGWMPSAVRVAGGALTAVGLFLLVTGWKRLIA